MRRIRWDYCLILDDFEKKLDEDRARAALPQAICAR
jgi:hypothetical protein